MKEIYKIIEVVNQGVSEISFWIEKNGIQIHVYTSEFGKDKNYYLNHKFESKLSGGSLIRNIYSFSKKEKGVVKKNNYIKSYYGEIISINKNELVLDCGLFLNLIIDSSLIEKYTKGDYILISNIILWTHNIKKLKWKQINY